MIWLATQMWGLLLLAFAIGLGTGALLMRVAKARPRKSPSSHNAEAKGTLEADGAARSAKLEAALQEGDL